MFEDISVRRISWLSGRHCFKKAWPLFRPDRKRKSGRFQTSSRFQKVPFLWHISVDDRPNCKDKVPFLWQISVDVRPHRRDKVSPAHFWRWHSKLYLKSPFSPSMHCAWCDHVILGVRPQVIAEVEDSQQGLWGFRSVGNPKVWNKLVYSGLNVYV